MTPLQKALVIVIIVSAAVILALANRRPPLRVRVDALPELDEVTEKPRQVKKFSKAAGIWREPSAKAVGE